MKKRILSIIGSVLISIVVTIGFRYFYWGPIMKKSARKYMEYGRQDLRKTLSIYNTAVLPRNINGGPYAVTLQYDSTTNTVHINQYYAEN